MKNLIKINSQKSSSYFSRLNWFLFFTLLVLVINLEVNSNEKKELKNNEKNLNTNTNTKTETKTNTNTNTNTNTKTETETETETLTEASLSSTLKGIFWVQRMYPGNDVLDNMLESEYTNSKRYLEVNDEIVYIAESIEKKGEVEDSLKIRDIYDTTNDNFQTADCCSRVTYEEFPMTNSIHNIIPARKEQKLKRKKSFLEKSSSLTLTKEKKDSSVNPRSCPKGTGGRGNTNIRRKAKNIPASRISPVTAPSLPKKVAKKLKLKEEYVPNLCILIHIPDEAKWRICSTSKKEINKLHIKINYSVIKLLSKNNPKIIEKIISNPKIFTKPTIGAWNWDNQNQWKNKCKSSFMQSPINISTSAVQKPKTHFDMSMNLKEVNTLIKKNFGEVIVVFRNFGGVLKLSSVGGYLNYTPQYMSFRFPGETIIDGKRSEGDLQLHFAELTEKSPNTALTNGLIMNIPIKMNNKKLNIKPLDDLNMDFWRSELNKYGSYEPRNFISKELISFSLPDLAKLIVATDSTYMIHMGSETIPPCKENIIHITLDNPIELPACQFNLLRNQSLVKTRAKEIHTRYEVASNDRPVYYFNKRALSYIPNVNAIVPESYEKYTLTNTKEVKRANKIAEKKAQKRKNAVFRRFKNKTVIKMVNGKPVKKKIRVLVKSKKGKGPFKRRNTAMSLSKKINQRVLLNNKNKGFGPGFKNGKKLSPLQLSQNSCTL